MRTLKKILLFKTYCFLVALVLFNNKELSAQTLGTNVVTSDFESWISAGVQLKIHKKLTIGLSEEIRLMKNSSVIDQYFTNLSIKYSPLKWFQIGTGFRFTQFNEEDGTYTPHYRIHLDVAFKHKIKRFSLKYRLRYQFRNEIGVTSEEGDYFKHRFRLKAAVSYNIKKLPLEPKLSVELFNKYEKYTLLQFDKLRFTAALAYDLKKYGKISAFFRVEQEIFKSYPKTTSIVGLSYVYTINIKKKKK